MNEGHANVSALRLRLKDVMNENATMTQELYDSFSLTHISSIN